MEESHDSLFLRGNQLSSNNRGEYGLVTPMTSAVDADYEEEDNDDDNDGLTASNIHKGSMQAFEVEQGAPSSSSSSSLTGWQRILFTPLLPDDRFEFCGSLLLDSVAGVRMAKFFVVTWVGLFGMYYGVRWMHLENDEYYTIPDMLVHELNPIMMDTMFFFIVGRLYRQRGIDHLAWLLTMMASGLFTSMETYFPFLQHSATLYSMHCLWPWTLWVFAIGLVTICALVLLLHVRALYQQDLIAMKIFEMSLCVILFLIPPATSSYLHLHHWFIGWLIGMHCNLDVWWSRLTMAWCWGAYINGIAVYGRDPVLTCGYAFYLSYSNRCPYLRCYVDEMKNHTHSEYQIMEAQDWRNCSAADYQP